MERTNFENLQIYKLSEKLSDQLWKIVVRWDVLARDMGKQLMRAVDSIGANIAEGSGRGTDPEIRRFLRIARGSLYETQHWLRRAYRRRLLNEREVNDLRPLVRELTPKLNAYLAQSEHWVKDEILSANYPEVIPKRQQQRTQNQRPKTNQ